MDFRGDAIVHQFGINTKVLTSVYFKSFNTMMTLGFGKVRKVSSKSKYEGELQ